MFLPHYKSCNNTYDENKINEKLTAIRQIQYDDYIRMKTREMNAVAMETHKWPTETVLIVSDSICCDLDEKRLSRKNKVKVRCFPGASISNMFHYLKPLLEKKPDYVIASLVETCRSARLNGAITKTSEVVLNELMEVKWHIENTLSSCVVIISEPTIRLDCAKASLAIKDMNEKLRTSNTNVMRNGNIPFDHSSKKGLHLNAKGTGRPALNIITYIRHL